MKRTGNNWSVGLLKCRLWMVLTFNQLCCVLFDELFLTLNLTLLCFCFFFSSAGIGRTGVLITMETALCLMECGQPVYPLDIVRTMRDQRAMMIQTPVCRPGPQLTCTFISDLSAVFWIRFKKVIKW